MHTHPWPPVPKEVAQDNRMIIALSFLTSNIQHQSESTTHFHSIRRADASCDHERMDSENLLPQLVVDFQVRRAESLTNFSVSRCSGPLLARCAIWCAEPYAARPAKPAASMQVCIWSALYLLRYEVLHVLLVVHHGVADSTGELSTAITLLLGGIALQDHCCYDE